ncbi:MAG: tRNA (adenosine(37)-N6)-threonylcarbamoyltransferase complex dimerization subunit type 1 TsaB [Polyangiaceae bacterium]
MLVLGVTTSTAQGGAGLAGATEQTADAASYVELKGHAERLFETIESVVATPARLEGVAVDVGPGSFTGIRVGVAAAHGIALARSLPITGVRSLEAIASGAARLAGVALPAIVVALIDAGKGEIFTARLRVDALDRVPALLGPIESLPAAQAIDRARELHGTHGDLVAGPTARAQTELPGAIDLAPPADVVATLGRARLLAGAPLSLSPEYIRPPDAVLPTR